MQFVLGINVEGFAFGEDDETARNEELARLLRYVADSVSDSKTRGVLRDYNGNRVGVFALEA